MIFAQILQRNKISDTTRDSMSLAVSSRVRCANARLPVEQKKCKTFRRAISWKNTLAQSQDLVSGRVLSLKKLLQKPTKIYIKIYKNFMGAITKKPNEISGSMFVITTPK
jgi:hypothetical protein